MSLQEIKNQAKLSGATEMYYVEQGSKARGIVFMPIHSEYDKSIGKWNTFDSGFGASDGIELGSNLKPKQFKDNMKEFEIKHEYL